MHRKKTIKTALMLLALLKVFSTAAASENNVSPGAYLNTRSTRSDFGAVL